MVMTCWAPGCNHNNLRESCRFFRFPSQQKTYKKWLQVLRRIGEPAQGSRICSCHFKDGNKENGPTIFDHNKDKLFDINYICRDSEKRQRRQPAKYSPPEIKKVKKKSKQPVTTSARKHDNIDSGNMHGSDTEDAPDFGNMHGSDTDDAPETQAIMGIKTELPEVDIKIEIQEMDIKQELQELNIKKELQEKEIESEVQEKEIEAEAQETAVKTEIIEFEFVSCD